MLAAYLHNIDPFAIWPIRWYGLSYLAGFIAGYFIIQHIVHRGNSPLKMDQIQNLIVVIAIGVMVGGRLGYVILYEPKMLVTFRSSLPFWDLLAINRGGMASHGGLIGLVGAAWWFSRSAKISFVHILDLTTFAGPIGVFFGRVANFANGELYGRPCAEDFLLAVKFPQEIATCGLQELDRLRPLMPVAESDAIIAWAIKKVQEGNQHVIEIVEPLLVPRHPSQLYEAVLEGLLLFGVLAAAWAKPRRPGVIFGLCCAVYGVVRVVGEFFREPDNHIAYLEAATLGVTRGQWLSAILFFVGITTMALCGRRNVEPLGGWRSSHLASRDGV